MVSGQGGEGTLTNFEHEVASQVLTTIDDGSKVLRKNIYISPTESHIIWWLEHEEAFVNTDKFIQKRGTVSWANVDNY